MIRMCSRSRSPSTARSRDSPIARALIDAVEAGSRSRCWSSSRPVSTSRRTWSGHASSRKEGVHVVYGVVGLKTHTKVAQVVRREARRASRRYSHVATGNYNSDTARIYEDLGVLSADPTLGDDLTHAVQLASRDTGWCRACSAWSSRRSELRSRILALIAGELPTGDRVAGRIVMKMNSLVDRRGDRCASTVRPRHGWTSTWSSTGSAVSSPGQEHRTSPCARSSAATSTLPHLPLRQRQRPRPPYWAIGSADMMPRNLDARVEAVVEVAEVLRRPPRGDRRCAARRGNHGMAPRARRTLELAARRWRPSQGRP